MDMSVSQLDAATAALLVNPASASAGAAGEASVAAVQEAITAGDIVVGGTPALNVVPTAGAAQTLIVGRNLLTLTAATCALTLPTLADGAEVIVRLKQDGTGGRLVTWPGTVKWPFDVAPVLQTGAGAADEFALVGDGSVWRGVATGAWSS